MTVNRHEHHEGLRQALADHLVEHHGVKRGSVDELGSVVVLDGLHRGYHMHEELSAAPRDVEASTWVRLRFDSAESALSFMESVGYLKENFEFADGIEAANIQNDEWSWG